MKKLILVFLGLAFFTACDKQNESEIMNQDAKENLPEQFISAQIGNELYTYSPGLINEYLYQSASTGSHIMDQLSLSGISENSEKGMHLFIIGSQFHNLSFPVSLSHVEGVSTEFQFIEYNSPADTTFGINDDWSYVGELSQFIIESYNDSGFLEGKFNGAISTRTGKSLNVEDGSFRVKIIETDLAK
ncbi:MULTISPECIES: hypothetical protein [unclassified Lentimicrobium]|uniref:hypothetical protein n=1 Tax=unclassified Lentimicrobium TaxID=2677434 RepID=UPI0015535BB0|nr:MULTISPECIES: hypothetical protein [unclassified Lentimicrobium]NPD44671.1 hypothetical protein [Lentimicrobium sp. S6]NPD85851.1 hypothetical protein [Lentimicrobium sp. L6]